MTDSPFFSIVLATYGRGRHIEPTILSVLRQTFTDFELIVVGDGCADETEGVVKLFAQEKVAWRNLAQNTGSQSFPNNEGIRCSHGRWICYIGHDDIWAPDHLEQLSQAIGASDADLAVSGCIYYGPPGSDVYYVTGLFDTPDAPFRHFFPPSSVAHRRDVTARIGDWRDPRIIKPAVDVEFLLRAAHAGLRFITTGRITVHKFAAGHRYLSYLRQDSGEQRDMLQALQEKRDLEIERIVATSKRSGYFMAAQYADYSTDAVGSHFEQNRQNKGLSRPALQPLHRRTVIGQTDESRALDWYAVDIGHKRSRWSGPSPRPKILIPFSGERARVSIEVVWTRPGALLDEVSLFAEGRKVACTIEAGDGIAGLLVAQIALKPDDHTVLTLETPMFCPDKVLGNGDRRMLGIAVSDIVVEPL